VLTVSWNSLPFLSRMLAATRAMSPDGTEIVVIDNDSSDGTREFLAEQDDVRAALMPVNLGHGVALDVVLPQVDTEHVAVLDVDAFPVSPTWLEQSLAALESSRITGAHLHRNFVHPCYLVTRTQLIHRYGLTFAPVGSLARLEDEAPLFLDVAEALSQRLIIKFGGSKAMTLVEPTSIRGPGMAGTVFGGLVYHNMYATQGVHRPAALDLFVDEFRRYHPDLEHA
jgi:glycosyltransferase involved in cell wall biosynthesis